MSSKHQISVYGASQNNLKNLNFTIPHGQLTVVTGPSGCGKSSLAFQTLYAEGQRRYVETFSPYVRQFFDRMDKPAVRKIDGIPPAIAIEQKNTIRSSRSTVGTLTELNDYLKLFFSRTAKGYDPHSGEEIRPDSPQTIVKWAIREHPERSLMVLFPVEPPSEERSREEFCDFLSSQGYLRLYAEGRVYRTDEPEKLDWKAGANLYVVLDRLKVNEENQTRAIESIERALLLGKGEMSLAGEKEGHNELLRTFSDEWYNPQTGTRLARPVPGLFSFNSPIGACQKCRGFGRVIGIDLQKAVPNPNLSLAEGCVKPFQGERGRDSQRDLLRLAKEASIPTTIPFAELSEEEREWVFYGESLSSPSQDLPVTEQLWLEGKWYGIQGFFDSVESKAYKMHVRIFLAKYRSYTICPSCRGKRLKPEALCYRVGEYTLPQLWTLPVRRLLPFIQSLSVDQSSSDKTIKLVYEQVLSRLEYLERVGLGYLTLDRQAATLSGGEIARVNLTSCLGASLTHTLFVLDEPTVGLHPRDVSALTDVMHDLRDKGNTLVVLEHEEAVMRSADHLIDMGPGAGHLGGEILHAGALPGGAQMISGGSTKKAAKPSPILPSPLSPTLAYLMEEKKIALPTRRRVPTAFLALSGLTEHNLREVEVAFPLGVLCAVTGVSGSGKSTLIERGLYENLLAHFEPEKARQPAPLETLEGLEHLRAVSFIDQTPLSQTPRSTPAVYLGAFNEIRQLFALTSEAKLRGCSSGYFSFNSGAGRCERCAGNGFEKVEMQFLSDLYLTCPECEGKRYQKTALELTYQGKNIAEVLELTVDEALAFFGEEDKDRAKPLQRRHDLVVRTLSVLSEVGLGYLRLGQALNTLSGGESQRVKIASLLLESEKDSALVSPKLGGTADTPRAVKARLDELAKKRKKGGAKTPQKGSLLILDEPTTGLHFGDIAVLLKALTRLVEAGHSLIVVEHNLEVIKCADYVIDLGPEAGENGGQIMGVGTPEEIASLETLTAQYLRPHLSASFGSIASATPASPSPSVPRKVAPKDLSRSAAIEIRGARHHNLKNLDLDLPHRSFNVVTGLSGSGKSTLAFDVIFAEGQRRFLDSMSPYARQFAEQLEKPEVDRISGLPPTVAIEQRISRGGGKSTVATITEIYHFLRLLFARLGTQHCPVSGEPVVSQTEAALFEKVKEQAEKGRIHLMAPVIKGRKGFHSEVAQKAERMGYQALFVDQQIMEVSDFEPLSRYKEHDIDIIICAGTGLSKKTACLKRKAQ